MTLSRKDHTCAQTRELACTKLVLPQVLSKGNQLKLKIHLDCDNYCRVSGLNVVEVAHDNCTSVRSYVVNDLKLRNSDDTWHGECDW